MTIAPVHGAVGPASPVATVNLAVVDVDSGFVRVLTRRLADAGWPHRVLASPVPPASMLAMRLNAVVVDLALVRPDAWAYLEGLCARLPHLGVVVCTGSSSVADRVRGLQLGADDWITKPCHPQELIARVAAVVRRRLRAEVGVQAAPLVVGELDIRGDRFQAYVRGVSVDLTPREFALIRLLAEAADTVLPREEIYQRVWGYAMMRGDRSVDVFVRKLRLKLQRVSPGWRYIHTHFGVGYSLTCVPVDGMLRRPAQVKAFSPNLHEALTAAT